MFDTLQKKATMNVINITLNPNLNRNKYISDHMSLINFNVLKKEIYQE